MTLHSTTHTSNLGEDLAYRDIHRGSQQSFCDFSPKNSADNSNATIGATQRISSKARSGFMASARDEMNLAEFPLAVLSTRTNPNIKTLEFVDNQRLKTGELIERKWTITAADKFGLPTSTDDDVVLGLMQLTKEQGFRERKVYFTRYELLRALRWTTEGRSYSRLTKSLDRLSGVRIKAANAFFDNATKAYQTVNFGIIDAYEINDSRGGLGGEQSQQKSFFIWSEKLFDSFKSGYIKKLDLELYFSLNSAVSRRLYRYLDKHTYFKSTIEKNLMVLAFEKLGLSRTYKYVSSIKQQLEPSIDELTKVGFLSSVSYSGAGKDTVVRFAVNQVVNHGGSQLGNQVENRSASVNRSAIARGNIAAEVPASGANAPIGDFSEKQTTDSRRAEATYQTNRLPDKINAEGNAEEGALALKIASQLVERGLTAQQASRLLRGRGVQGLERITSIISHFDKQSNERGTPIPLGLLYRSVENPDGFKLPGDRKSADSAQSSASGFIQRRTQRPELKVFSSNRNLGEATDKQTSAGNGAVGTNSEKVGDSFQIYEMFIDREIARVKAELPNELLKNIFEQVCAKMSCLRSVISDERYTESIEKCFDEEIRKHAGIPDYRAWLVQEGLVSRKRG